MKKTLLGFFSFGLISLLFCLKPTSANASSYFTVESTRICYNSRTLYNNPYGRCYNGNWRFNTSVKNIGDSSNANEPGVVNPDYDYGYYAVSSVNYGIVKEGFSFWVSNIILAPEEHRDFYQTVTGIPCNVFYLRATGSLLDDQHVEKDWKVIDIDSVGPCLAAPTATPTPTPISCPLAIQSMSFLGSGTPLINDYNTTQYKGSPQYTVVNSNKTGKVTKAEIYGTLDRDVARGNKVLQCKITDNTGTTNLGESNTNNGPFSKGVFWFPVTFPTPVNVVNGISYRLYCKVNNVYGGGSIYWLDDWRNRTSKAYRLYLCE